MLLYWGFSSDGFGRNCLEPMSVALLIAAAAGWKRSSSPLVPLALAGVFLEGMWVVISGFVGAEGFSWRAWAWDAWGWLLLAVAIGAGVLVWAIAIWRSPWAEAAPECHSEP
jgi:hypothetical protein